MITVIGPIDPQEYWQQCLKILTFFYLQSSLYPSSKVTEHPVYVCSTVDKTF